MKQTEIGEKDDLTKRFYAFHEDIGRLIKEQNEKNKISIKGGSSFALDELVESEKTTMIKAFVNSSGNIRAEYTFSQKIYLGFLKRFRKKTFIDVKEDLDDTIIEECAEQKLDYLKELRNKAIKSAAKTLEKKREYEEKQSKLKRESSIELETAKNLRELKRDCEKYILDLNKKIDQELDDGKTEKLDELQETISQAKRDLDDLGNLYMKTCFYVDSLQRKLQIVYPVYIKLALYAEAMQKESLCLESAYDLYSTIYEESKSARAMDLLEFKSLDDEFIRVLEQYAEDANETAQSLLSLLGSDKGSTKGLANWEEILNSYKNSMDNFRNDFLNTLNEEQERIKQLDKGYEEQIE